MKVIDLRSDTVTRPTDEMRAAMAAAEVGDDVYGEDPTVNRLEEESAMMTGHEAGLFVTSGTQGNAVALLTHCSRGDGAILGSDSHIYIYEGGGLSALGGILPLVAEDSGGII
ncbi:MAG TPA: beta-eliminating lyase-related protein, partial [Synergistales bacterium]|nr:beta-eliminating lyase-related protein [Synergistales bacterium]